MEFLNWTRRFWVENETNCLEFLLKDANWKLIPLLNVNNLEDLQDGSIVKFQGMVQDMFDPEYYLDNYEIINTVSKEKCVRYGKYADSIDCKDQEILNYHSENTVTKDRNTLVVISIPSINSWVKTIEAENKLQKKGETQNNQGISNKRSLESHETMEVEVNNDKNLALSNNEVKRHCVEREPQTEQNLIVSHDHIINFPIQEQSGKKCHIKIYDNNENIKLNDLIEFVGFLSVNPIVAEKDVEGECDMEMETHNPPPSLVPTMHCVTWKKLEHNNPLVNDIQFDVEKMQFLKKELHLILTQLLLGDGLAAEYLIYHLISNVYLRTDLLSLGKFTLNISKVPVKDLPNYVKCLYDFIELFVPKSYYLPMTLDNMNETNFIPKKDYECNRLTSGLLQLSKNTHLVLDETKLTSGRLNALGVQGIQAISDVIRNQKIKYDFNYYQLEYDCDISFLVVSEGKSLLPSDFHVPLKPDEACISTFDEIMKAAHHFLNLDLLNNIRIFLTLARHSKYDISDNLQKLVENEFVKMRQKNNVSADDLHQLLILARVICLSLGKSSLDEECWKKACSLEAERKARFCI